MRPKETKTTEIAIFSMNKLNLYSILTYYITVTCFKLPIVTLCSFWTIAMPQISYCVIFLGSNNSLHPTPVVNRCSLSTNRVTGVVD